MLYRLARGILRLYFSLCRGWVVEGVENIPEEGELIVVANHSSYQDPLILGAAMTRPVNFMGKVELFRYPLFGSLLRLLGAFPVKRKAVDRCHPTCPGHPRGKKGPGNVSRRHTEQNRPVGRSPSGGSPLATKSGAPILPAGIKREGAGGVVIRFGKPFYLEAEAGNEGSREKDYGRNCIIAFLIAHNTKNKGDISKGYDGRRDATAFFPRKEGIY